MRALRVQRTGHGFHMRPHPQFRVFFRAFCTLALVDRGSAALIFPPLNGPTDEAEVTEIPTTRTARYLPLLCAVALLAAPLPALGSGLGWSLIFGDSGSADLLEKLVETADFQKSSADKIETLGPDGPMPEISRQMVGVSGDAQAAIPALKKACTGLGLEAPDAGQAATEPDMICTGKFKEARVTVHASLVCRSACEVAIETRATSY